MAEQNNQQEERGDSESSGAILAGARNEDQLDEMKEAARAEQLDQEKNSQNVAEDQVLTTQGDDAEKEENLGGTTNLSLDQLKKEGGPETLI